MAINITCACGSPRWMNISSQCKGERCEIILGDTLGNISYRDPSSIVLVPECSNLGNNDYICFTICLNCGHVRGKWPVPLNIELTDEFSVDENETWYDPDGDVEGGNK